MLHEFLTANRDELVRRCRGKVGTIRTELGAHIAGSSLVSAEIGATAGNYGNEFFRKGFAVDQLVRDYGDLCQSVTDTFNVLPLDKGLTVEAGRQILGSAIPTCCRTLSSFRRLRSQLRVHDRSASIGWD